MSDKDSVASPAPPHSAPQRSGLSALAWRLRWLVHGVRLSLHLPRMAGRVCLYVWIVAAVLFLAVRHIALPQVAAQRERIVAMMSESLGMRLEIDALRAEWPGLRPRLDLEGLRLFDEAGREALRLPRVEATLAWSSLWRWRPELRQLRIIGPELSLRREADGRVFVAGMAVGGGGDGSLADRLLHQHAIIIEGASLSWLDVQRGAPPLSLQKLSLRLENDGEAHRFALRAEPSSALAGPLDVRGDLRGVRFSDPADWGGTLFFELRDTDLAVWRQWVDYPVVLQRGRGSLRAWVYFSGTQAVAVTTDLALAEVETRLADDLPLLSLKSLNGRLRMSRNQGDYGFAAERLRLETEDGLEVQPLQLSLRRFGVSEGRAAGGALSGERLNMRVLSQLAAYMPLPAALRARLEKADPRGLVPRIEASWEEPPGGLVGMPPRFRIDAQVEQLFVRGDESLPGVSGLSGGIRGSERKGSFNAEIREGSLELAGLLHEARVPVQQGRLAGGWAREPGGDLFVELAHLKLDNADLAGVELSGRWHGQPGAAGRIELDGRVRRADPAGLWRYIPLEVSRDTSDWLRTGLRGGQADNIRIRLAGALADFPFRDAQRDGEAAFRVEGRFSGLELAFAPDWPSLHKLEGDLLFDRARMLVRARSGLYQSVKLREVSAEIADLEQADTMPLQVRGMAEGAGEEMLDYLRATPVAAHLGSFIRKLRVAGDATLALDIAVPLLDAENTRVQGSVRLAGNTVHLAPGLPPFTNVRGSLGFTEQGLAPTEALGEFLGGHFSLQGRSLPDGHALFEASGQVPATNMDQLVASPLWGSISGKAAVGARVEIGGGRVELRVTSDLQGVASSLPAPLGKAAGASLPLLARWTLSDEVPAAAGQAAIELDDWRIELEGLGGAHWQNRCQGEECRFLRGIVAIGDELNLPQRGLRVAGRFGRLDADAWRPLIVRALADSEPARPEEKRAAGVLAGAVLRVDELIAGGHRFENVVARAIEQEDRWRLRLEGPDIAGDLTWQGEGHGLLAARLSMLRLRPVKGGGAGVAAAAVEADEKLPGLDIQAAQFELGGMKLGALSLLAENDGPLWRLPRLRIESPDGVIEGEGSSGTVAGGGKRSTVNLRLSTENAGAFLGRIGFPDAVIRGRARLFGNLAWNAAPTSVDYPSLSGELRLEAEDGQFNKLEPGAARLLGIISLQSLRRRITLDFRDVFSDGFAFDSITGDMKIERGVLNTSNLELRGPAARASMRGRTDLVREQHDLRVTVQPTLSEGVAVGVGAVSLNPIIGLVVYLTQKVLSDPLEKLFSLEYRISGDWADPKIDRLDGTPVPPRAPSPAIPDALPERERKP